MNGMPNGGLVPHGARITSAASHLEFADRARWTMRVLAVVAVPVLLALFVFGNDRTPDSGEADRQAQLRTCAQWHLAASAVVSRLVQSTREADLAQAGDALFRMRRARRNCDAGWVALACQDYHAVAAGLPGHVLTRQLFPCSRVATSAHGLD